MCVYIYIYTHSHIQYICIPHDTLPQLHIAPEHSKSLWTRISYLSSVWQRLSLGAWYPHDLPINMVAPIAPYHNGYNRDVNPYDPTHDADGYNK